MRSTGTRAVEDGDGSGGSNKGKNKVGGLKFMDNAVDDEPENAIDLASIDDKIAKMRRKVTKDQSSVPDRPKHSAASGKGGTNVENTSQLAKHGPASSKRSSRKAKEDESAVGQDAVISQRTRRLNRKKNGDAAGGSRDIEEGGTEGLEKGSSSSSNATNVAKQNAKSIPTDEETLKKIRNIIESQFDFEIFMKRQEIRVIRDEIEKGEDLLAKLHFLFINDGDMTSEVALSLFGPSTRESTSITTSMTSGIAGMSALVHPSGRPLRTAKPKVQRSTFDPSLGLLARREDGVFVKLSCPGCQRSDFLNLQGFVNHCRIVHQIDVGGHSGAIRDCGTPVDEKTVPESHPVRLVSTRASSSTSISALMQSGPEVLSSGDAGENATPNERPKIKVFEEDVDMDAGFSGVVDDGSEDWFQPRHSTSILEANADDDDNNIAGEEDGDGMDIPDSEYNDDNDEGAEEECGNRMEEGNGDDEDESRHGLQDDADQQDASGKSRLAEIKATSMSSMPSPPSPLQKTTTTMVGDDVDERPKDREGNQEKDDVKTGKASNGREIEEVVTDTSLSPALVQSPKQMSMSKSKSSTHAGDKRRDEEKTLYDNRSVTLNEDVSDQPVDSPVSSANLKSGADSPAAISREATPQSEVSLLADLRRTYSPSPSPAPPQTNTPRSSTPASQEDDSEPVVTIAHASSSSSSLDSLPNSVSADRGSRFYIKRRIVVGNVSQYIPTTSRAPGMERYAFKWMVYLRGTPTAPDVTPFIQKVRFFLHPDYKPYDVVDVPATEAGAAGFRMKRFGWGEFPVRLQLFFVDRERNKPVDVIHILK
ncbi:YEATS domain-containing protein 2, partial [Quaeritorhiza haematococci]